MHGRQSLHNDANEMFLRLEVRGVFNQLCYLTAKRWRVGRSLRREVDAVGVAGEDHMTPTRSRAPAAPPGASPLQSGKVDRAPGRYRRPLAPRRTVLAAVEGQQLAAGLLKQLL